MNITYRSLMTNSPVPKVLTTGQTHCEESSTPSNICLYTKEQAVRTMEQSACGQQCVPDSKVHGANMGPIWGRQDPGGLYVGPMNLAVWDVKLQSF